MMLDVNAGNGDADLNNNVDRRLASGHQTCQKL
jgi:hypothetical protein